MPDDADEVPALRFAGLLSQAFPASDVQSLQAIEDADLPRLRMTVSFMGMTGPGGALPPVYTEALLARRHLHRDLAAQDFLDIFSHRAVSLFHAAWVKHRFPHARELGERDRFMNHLLDLAGAGLSTAQAAPNVSEGEFPQELPAYFSGLLAQRPLPAASIEALVRHALGVPVRLEQFVGQWITVAPEQQARLGGMAATLSGSACLGVRAWERQLKVRIVLGPLAGDAFRQHLPGSSGYRRLQALMRFCCGEEFACDLKVLMQANAITAARLSSDGEATRLGQDGWLLSRPSTADASDACFCLLE
ncbi:type VI secretion system protein ImpH [Noviherbaspirillum humi]|uniref:Type VI secretion system protein ImpH n=1 Tax=Noviherbaspirillum humi TaxID=1688639 RepID=A0A239DJY5_9BURK|nr:type VI secretion system baseplate subunit TssG [Noviherbaspirillum humi]SNS32727.1 type VI secretion system protein ImpH [Noviherbaspirillum humi]